MDHHSPLFLTPPFTSLPRRFVSLSHHPTPSRPPLNSLASIHRYHSPVHPPYQSQTCRSCSIQYNRVYSRLPPPPLPWNANILSFLYRVLCCRISGVDDDVLLFLCSNLRGTDDNDKRERDMYRTKNEENVKDTSELL